MTQRIAVSVVADSRDAVRGFREAGDQAQGMGARFVKAAAATAALAAGFAAVKVGQFLTGAVKGASDLGEAASKVGVVFGDGADDIKAWAATAATSLGSTQQQALDAASAFALYGKQAGLMGKELTGFAKQNTALATDLASFFNTTAEDASAAMASAFRGENDPIERYGVLINDAAVKTEAFKLGLIKTTKDAITPQNRVLAVQSLILAQTSAAQGDFTRTQAGLANQTRIAKAQFDGFKTTVGQALLPVVTTLATILTTKLMPALNQLWATHGPAITAFLQKMADQLANVDFGKIADQLGGLVTSGLDSLKNIDIGAGVSAAADAAGRLAPVLTQIGPELAKVKAEAGPAFSDSMNVFGTVMRFAADNADVLAKALPYLAVGYGVVKVAQIGANAAAAVSPVLRIAEVFANRRLAASNLELIATMRAQSAAAKVSAASTATDTAATNVGALTRVRSAVATVAATTATIAASAATKAAAAAQWLFNAAMSANPIGIVIAIIVALVAAFIIAYQKSETFRNIVDGALRAVGAAFAWLWDGVKKVFGWLADNWPLVLAIITGPIGLAVLFVVRNWDTIKEKTVAVFTAISSFLGGIWDWIKAKFQQGVAALLTIWAGITALYDKAIAVRDQVAAAFAGLVDRVIGVGKDIMNGLVRGLDAGIGWVRDKVKGLAGLIPDWLKSALGISSPSKVTADIGRNIMRGLTGGMQRQLPALRRTVVAAAGAISGLAVSPAVALRAGMPAIADGAIGGRGVTSITNVNVAVTPLSDPAEVGRQVVKAVQAHQDQVGRTYLAAGTVG